MAYEVSVPAGRDYVEVKWRGEIVSAEMRSSGKEALTLASEQRISKILVDVTELRNRLGIVDLYANTVEHSQLGSERPKAALVGRTDQAKDLTFIENVGSNRGMPIKSFTDRAEALDWLSQ